MDNQEKRPVPECVISFVSAGTAEPVRINCPSSSLWSTSKRIASQSFGAICHSSIRRGVSPLRSLLGFMEAMATFCSINCGSSIYRILAAICSAVVVFPHHLGPSMRTAPEDSNLSESIWSATRFLYSFIYSHILFAANLLVFNLNIKYFD